MLTPFAPAPKKASYRHVVFADSVGERRVPMNFSPLTEPQRQQIDSLTADENSFASWLFNRAGLRSNQYRQETIIRRLPACLRMIRARNVLEARAMLEANPSLIQVAIGALVIGVSGFFRDAGVFSILRTSILPALGNRNRPMRIWSVGCSDGQELYSITIMLAEMGLLNQADLLGTDCRVSAVRHAAHGFYSAGDVRSVPANLLEKYFAANEEGWRIAAPLRTVVRWRTADVLQLVEPGAWDLILCRNFAMYLEPESAISLWQKLRRILRPGGVLIVGKAERPTIDGLRPVAPCIFSRNRG